MRRTLFFDSDDDPEDMNRRALETAPAASKAPPKVIRPPVTCRGA
jgi:hypothetical protein